MKPEESNSSQSGLSLSKQGLTSDAHNNQYQQTSQDAAAKVIRSQIENLYDKQNNSDTKNLTEPDNIDQLEDINPYQRTHSKNPTLQTNDWKHYHSAWQDYYQKYYEGYYKHNQPGENKTNNAKIGTRQRSAARNNHNNYFTNQIQDKSEPEKAFSSDEAMFDMRQELIVKVRKSATKIKKSRHFIPILTGVAVVLIFTLLQYNRMIVSNVMAYVSPGNIDPQNIVIDPNVDLVVGPEPKLIIPKINIDVPVMYDIGNDYASQMSAMTKGVAHFAIPGANSHPGEIGNTVIAGHSSNDLLDSGDYKFIFAQLDKLNIGDTIYTNYNSKRYTYLVTKKEVVKPSEVSKLIYPTTKPLLTLLTCTPLGTALNRLLVTAEQISPDPSESKAAPINDKAEITSIPGNSPTFFERLFGAK